MNVTIGLDIGGTSVKIAALDDHCRLHHESAFPTDSIQGIEQFLTKTRQAIDSVLDAYGAGLAAIGVGCTGPIDYRTGIIENPYTLPGLEGHSISDLLHATYGVPVAVDNDANAAHLGEIFLRPQSPSDTMMLTFGTGVGVSVRMDNALFRIPGGIHPEMGHIGTSVYAPDACYCKKKNCMEHILSGTGINRRALQQGWNTPEALAKDPAGQQFLQELETALFDSINTLATIFHPRTVYIGGGMQRFFETYLIRPVQQSLDELLPIYGKTTLTPCTAGQRAGSLGAALLAYQTYIR